MEKTLEFSLLCADNNTVTCESSVVNHGEKPAYNLVHPVNPQGLTCTAEQSEANPDKVFNYMGWANNYFA